MDATENDTEKAATSPADAPETPAPPVEASAAPDAPQGGAEPPAEAPASPLMDLLAEFGNRKIRDGIQDLFAELLEQWEREVGKYRRTGSLRHGSG